MVILSADKPFQNMRFLKYNCCLEFLDDRREDTKNAKKQ